MRTTPLGITLLLVGLSMGCTPDDPAPTGDGVVVVGASDTSVRSGVRSPLVGESMLDVPDTRLVNRHGRPVSFEALADSPALIGFIYTRCPDPNMCPLTSRKVHTLARRTDAGVETPPRLVLITLDPKHDTPAVLRRYVRRRGLEHPRLSFWTGPADVVEHVHDRFGITALWPEERSDTAMVHNLRLYLLDRRGVVRAAWTGADWNLDAVMRRLRSP